MLPNTTTPVEQKQVPDELMREIAHLYLALEPENLWMDGEATPAQARARSVEINRKLKAAWARAGRVVTDSEAFEWYMAHRNEAKKKPTDIFGQIQGLQEELARLREGRVYQDPPPNIQGPLQNSGEDYYEIAPEDVGKYYLRLWGRMWPVTDFLGRILKQDVGKRVFLRGGVLQVENPEQMAARLAHSEDKDSKETIPVGSRVRVKDNGEGEDVKGALGFVRRVISGEEGERSYFVDLDDARNRPAVFTHDRLQVVKKPREEWWERGTKVRVNKDIPDYGGETGEIVTTKRTSAGWHPGQEAIPILLVHLDRQQDQRLMPFRPDEVAVLEAKSTSCEEVDFRGFKKGDRVAVNQRAAESGFTGKKGTITDLETSRLQEPLCVVKMDSDTDPDTGFEWGGGETVFYPWELALIHNEAADESKVGTREQLEADLAEIKAQYSTSYYRNPGHYTKFEYGFLFGMDREEIERVKKELKSRGWIIERPPATVSRPSLAVRVALPSQKEADEQGGDTRTPGELPNHTLVTDSQDVQAVCDSVDVDMAMNDITGALVVVGEGDYEDVWLTDSSRPFDINADYHRPAYFDRTWADE